jgi:hypothetical protein|tara:strand:- start:6076 stop:6792 length:717 start_codon:yes stop_codon:yes gene_type:complete
VSKLWYRNTNLRERIIKMIIEENRHDFRQRYRTCSVLLQHLDRDEQVIFYIEDVDEDREFITGSYIDNNNEWFPVRWRTEDIAIDFKFPELGLLNAKKGVVRLTRIATQQYRQSYNSRVINVKQLNPSLNEIFNLPTLTYEDLKRPLFIKDIFFPAYFPVGGALNRIMSNDRYAGAISKDLYLTCSWSSEGIYLGYKDVIIGKMRNSTVFNPTVDLFTGNNDLIDLVQIQGIHIGGML